ncbi:hypothetical protein [Burkholderia cenocepacia]|uniref:hypothetical protein n=1 Tax=Burkholderia cenocepacia TaxID=95486 RepID=UPI00158AF7CE|nr:hypothetical protein [Burkholderia cenocepacia]
MNPRDASGGVAARTPANALHYASSIDPERRPSRSPRIRHEIGRQAPFPTHPVDGHDAIARGSDVAPRNASFGHRPVYFSVGSATTARCGRPRSSLRSSEATAGFDVHLPPRAADSREHDPAPRRVGQIRKALSFGAGHAPEIDRLRSRPDRHNRRGDALPHHDIRRIGRVTMTI